MNDIFKKRFCVGYRDVVAGMMWGNEGVSVIVGSFFIFYFSMFASRSGCSVITQGNY